MRDTQPETATEHSAQDRLRESRRQLVRDGLAIAAYALPVGLVYGLLTVQAHFSLPEVLASSIVVLAGGSQFAAATLVLNKADWGAIAAVTLLVNARHLLYSAAIAPYLAGRSLRERVVMAHFLTDETFALSLAHFRRIGRFDTRAYWLAAMVIFIPWVIGSAAGNIAAGAVDIKRLGLDAAFPAAMAGLSLGMVSGRRDVAAAAGAVLVAVALGLAAGTAVGLVSGAAIGPLIGLAVPERQTGPTTPETSDDATARAAREGLP
jgi:4-azaleucine resistance transporter AzlC